MGQARLLVPHHTHPGPHTETDSKSCHRPAGEGNRRRRCRAGGGSCGRDEEGVLGAGPGRRAGQEGWAALGDADGGEDGVG